MYLNQKVFLSQAFQQWVGDSDGSAAPTREQPTSLECLWLEHTCSYFCGTWWRGAGVSVEETERRWDQVWAQCSLSCPAVISFPWLLAAMLMLSPSDSYLSLERLQLAFLPLSAAVLPPKLQLFSTHFITVASEALPCCFHANKANPVNAEWVSGDSNCFLSPVSLFLNVSFRINCTNY